MHRTPNQGAPYLTASTAPTVDEGGTPEFAESRLWRPFLAPGSVAIVLEARLDARGSILSSWGPFWGHFRFLGSCPSADSLTPCHFIFFGFSATRHDTVPIGTAPRFWIWGCHRFEKLPYGCRDPAILMCRGLGIFLTQRESVVETEQMSSVETGQMSAVETGQMSAAETGQMSSAETRQMFQQQSSVLSQQQTSVLSQQEISALSQQQTSAESEPYI